MAELAGQIENGVIDAESAYVVGFREHYKDALIRHEGAKRWLRNYQPYADQVLATMGLSLD